MTATTTRPQTGLTYAPRTATDRDALLAEGFACILQGRPFPDALRAAPTACVSVATCAEGIARILGGPSQR